MFILYQIYFYFDFSCIVFFFYNSCRFPLENPPLLQKWLDAMRQPGFKPASHHMLCSAHFRPEDFRSGLQKRLLQEGAVPSQFEHPKSSESTHVCLLM